MAHDLSGVSILVVDNPVEVRNMREALRDVGFNSVADMTDGLKVLTDIKKNPPEVIFVNYILPKYSGLQVFTSLMSDKSLASIKFVMIIPRLNRREVAEMEKAGVRHWLQRPFTPEDLREKIFNLFGMGMDALREVAEQTMRQAQEKFDEGDYETALRLFGEACGEFSNAECFLMQGRCYLELEMYDQAIAAFQNAKEEDHRFPKIDHWLGVAYQKKKDYLESVKLLEREAKRQNAAAETNLELGKSYLGADMVEKADAAFSTAIKKDPKSDSNRKEIGDAYLEKGLYDKAEAAYGEAIDINPGNIFYYNRMAIAQRRQGKHKEAINIYIKALGVAPKDEGLYYNLARALYESGEKEKAVKALDKALALDPDFSEAKELKEEYLNSG